MDVSAVMVTFRRAWSLPFALESLAAQSHRPDEVIVVLKPSGDGSEEIIKNYEAKLPIKSLIQTKGNFTDAVEMGYSSASHSLVLFMDDDAVAHKEWVERYVRFFSENEDAGGASGMTYKGYFSNDDVKLTQIEAYSETFARGGPHRLPLKAYEGYCGWISKSGFTGKKPCDSPIIRSAFLVGANMAWRKEAIERCPLSRAFHRSRIGFSNEYFLAYCSRIRGYNTYELRDPNIAPIVWHLQHSDSLTRRPSSWKEFWIHYDRVANYWRLKMLNADVSFYAYLIALAASMRRKPLPRILATLYGLAVRA